MQETLMKMFQLLLLYVTIVPARALEPAMRDVVKNKNPGNREMNADRSMLAS